MTLHTLVKTYRVTGLPLGGLAEIVERADDLEEGVSRALTDALVEVGQEVDKLERALLDIREEVLPCGCEDCADRVCRDFLLDVHTRAHVEDGVYIRLTINIDLIVRHVDGARRREASRKAGGDLGVRDYGSWRISWHEGTRHAKDLLDRASSPCSSCVQL